MNNDLPTVVRFCRDDTTIEVCHGEIPDVCRLLRFDPITEFELPDTKGSDEEFDIWLCLYRHATPVLEKDLLGIAKCN